MLNVGRSFFRRPFDVISAFSFQLSAFALSGCLMSRRDPTGFFAEELQRLGWSESELASHRKSAAGKLALAARLRRETTMPLKWIAARVRLGTSKSANSKLHLWMKENQKPGADAVMAPVATGSPNH